MPLTNSPKYVANWQQVFQINFVISSANTRNLLWPHQQWLLGQSTNAAASWLLEQSGNDSAAAARPQLADQSGKAAARPRPLLPEQSEYAAAVSWLVGQSGNTASSSCCIFSLLYLHTENGIIENQLLIYGLRLVIYFSS